MEKQKKHYTYVSNGETKTVWCTTREFIELKRNYDDNGLTQLEEEYATLLDKLDTATENLTRCVDNIKDNL